MNEQDFWAIIGKSSSPGDRQKQLGVLCDELQKLSQQDYRDFAGHFGKAASSLASRDEIVNAAYLVFDQCLSLDMFDYFCWWLVSMGRSTIHEITANPDVLVDLLRIHLDPNFEEFGVMVYSRNDGVVMSNTILSKPTIKGRIWPRQTLEKRLPRLFAYSGA